MINDQALSLFITLAMHNVMEKKQVVPIIRILSGKVTDRDGMNSISHSIDLIYDLKERYDEICIVDVDGTKRNKPQLKLVQELGDEINIWLDGGVRHTENVVDYLIAGALKVVVNFQNFSLNELKRTCSLTDNVALFIDYENIVKNKIKHAELMDLIPSMEGIGIDILIFPKGCRKEIFSLPNQNMKMFIRDSVKNVKGIDEIGIEDVLVEV